MCKFKYYVLSKDNEEKFRTLSFPVLITKIKKDLGNCTADIIIKNGYKVNIKIESEVL